MDYQRSFQNKIRGLHLDFARTIKAVDSPSKDPDSQFHRFSDLPCEIRLAIWEQILPDPEAEPGVIFSQTKDTRGESWEGELYVPHELVPIRMTTTCAALLHVNKESRSTTLEWAKRQGYELTYRAYCTDLDDWDDGNPYFNTEPCNDPDQLLPVHGPIFVRRWNPEKDILHIFSICDSWVPEEWNELYIDGEELENVQHIAFSADDLEEFLRSPWFYQLLAATVDLKSISIEYEHLMEGDGAAFSARHIDTTDIGDPYCPKPCGWEGRRKYRSDNVVQVRWEMTDCDREVLERFEETKFKERLMRDYLDPDLWSPNGKWSDVLSDDKDDNDDDGGEKEKQNFSEGLPPWIFDPKTGERDFEIRPFRIIERRGYDDVSGGLVATCDELHGFK